MNKSIALLLMLVFVTGCSTTQKETGARNTQTAATIGAIGGVPGAGIIGFGAAIYDFVRHKPKFQRTDGVNQIILKRIPGYPTFYKSGLDKFRSGELMGAGSVREANEKLYAEGKRLYLLHEEGSNKIIFAFSSESDVVNVMTSEEMAKEIGGAK